MILTIGVLVLTLVVTERLRAAQQGYYTWVDEDGITNYSQENPKNVDAELVTTITRFGRRIRQTPRAAERSSPADTSFTAGNRQSRGGQLPESKETIAIREEIARVKVANCEIGRQNLVKLESFARIRVPDGSGGERVLSEEERASRIQTNKKTISVNCGAG